jgi:predicted nicotinamide N-methyase
VRRPDLVPEIRLRLLRDEVPIGAADEDGLFSASGPRPYWAFAWASGQALARFLLDEPGRVRGRCVLDFGSGSGIVAIAAAQAGAASIAAWDLDPRARHAIRENAVLNGVSLRVLDAEPGPRARASREVLLAGDVCYAESGFEILSRLAPHYDVTLVADPGRPGLPKSRLERLAMYAVQTFPRLEASLRTASVYRLR